MADSFGVFSPWWLFLGYGVRSRISPQHHSCYAKISMREDKGTRAKHSLPFHHPGHSPRKLILAGRLPSLLQMLRAINPEGIIPLICHLIPSRNILMCMPWVVCYQSLRTIGSIKFIIPINHHSSPDLSTVKNVLVK